MNRRERIERIVAYFIPSWPGRPPERFVLKLLNKRGLTIFTDEALEEMASDMVREHKFTMRLHRENRKRATERTPR